MYRALRMLWILKGAETLLKLRILRILVRGEKVVLMLLVIKSAHLKPKTN